MDELARDEIGGAFFAITPSGRRLLGRASRIVAEVDALEAQVWLFDG